MDNKRKMGNFDSRPDSETCPTGSIQQLRPRIRHAMLLNFRTNSTTNDVETSESQQQNGYEKLVN